MFEIKGEGLYMFLRRWSALSSPSAYIYIWKLPSVVLDELALNRSWRRFDSILCVSRPTFRKRNQNEAASGRSRDQIEAWRRQQDAVETSPTTIWGPTQTKQHTANTRNILTYFIHENLRNKNIYKIHICCKCYFLIYQIIYKECLIHFEIVRHFCVLHARPHPHISVRLWAALSAVF